VFGIGFWELCLLLLIALMVLGPERLPVVARKLGYWTGRARAVAGAVRDQLEQEVSDAEHAAKRVVNPQSKTLKDWVPDGTSDSGKAPDRD
jgi:sec-independent protein translocase protein TatB